MLNLCYPPLYVRPKRSYYYKNHTIILQAGIMRLSSFLSKRICFVTNYVTLIVTFAHPLNNLMCQQLTSITITLDVILPFFLGPTNHNKNFKIYAKNIATFVTNSHNTLCIYTNTRYCNASHQTHIYMWYRRQLRTAPRRIVGLLVYLHK